MVSGVLVNGGLVKLYSFNSFTHFIQIENQETYNDLSPTLGFRFFMQVIEK